MQRAGFLVLFTLLSNTALAQEPEQAGAEAEPARSEQDEARRLRTYARIGDVVLRVGDLEDRIAAQSSFMRERLTDPAKLEEFALGLVRSELLAREAERREYGDLAVVRRAYRESLVQNLIRQRVDEVVTRESVSDEDVQAYYDEHADEFRRPAMVRAAHLLVDTEAEAQALLEQARATDARGFRELVRDHSIDTETKYRGGDLRYFRRDGRTPTASPRPEEGEGAREQDVPVASELVEAAFGLETLGDVSDPVETGGNYSLVKLTGRRDAEHRPLSDAGEGIRLRLWRERRQAAIDRLARRLREEASVNVHSERLRQIHLDVDEPEAGFDDGHMHGATLSAPEPEGEEGEEAEASN